MCFFFGKFLTYPGNKYNNNCFFDLYWEYCPRSLHEPRKLSWYLDLGQYFLVQIKETIVILLVEVKFNRHLVDSKVPKLMQIFPRQNSNKIQSQRSKSIVLLLEIDLLMSFLQNLRFGFLVLLLLIFNAIICRCEDSNCDV